MIECGRGLAAAVSAPSQRQFPATLFRTSSWALLGCVVLLLLCCPRDLQPDKWSPQHPSVAVSHNATTLAEVLRAAVDGCGYIWHSHRLSVSVGGIVGADARSTPAVGSTSRHRNGRRSSQTSQNTGTDAADGDAGETDAGPTSSSAHTRVDTPAVRGTTIRVLVIGDHITTGVAGTSSNQQQLSAAPSYRLPLARLVSRRLAQKRTAESGPTTSAGDDIIRMAFVGRQTSPHGLESPGSHGADALSGQRPPQHTWSAPYEGSWSTTAEEVVMMGLAAGWIDMADPHVVVLQLGGNDLGRGAVELLGESASTRPPSVAGAGTNDGGAAPVAADADEADLELVQHVAGTVVAAARQAAAALAATDACHDHPSECTVVVLGLGAVDDRRHAHADLVAEVNAVLTERFVGDAQTAPNAGSPTDAAAIESNEATTMSKLPRFVFIDIEPSLQPAAALLRAPLGMIPTSEGETRIAEAVAPALEAAVRRAAAAAGVDSHAARTTPRDDSGGQRGQPRAVRTKAAWSDYTIAARPIRAVRRFLAAPPSVSAVALAAAITVGTSAAFFVFAKCLQARRRRPAPVNLERRFRVPAGGAGGPTPAAVGNVGVAAATPDPGHVGLPRRRVASVEVARAIIAARRHQQLNEHVANSSGPAAAAVMGQRRGSRAFSEISAQSSNTTAARLAASLPGKPTSPTS